MKTKCFEFACTDLNSTFFAIYMSRVRTFKNFKEHKQISLPIASADGMC